MEREEFERVAEEVFEALPAPFRGAIDNVRIVVEDHPHSGVRAGYRPGTLLLGLYEGVPLTKRGTSYGAYAVVPDTITLYRANIAAVSRSDDEMRAVLRDTLIHEIGHYFGMSEREIRAAGY
ncbi:MAG TPA: metallopeptidase family protein [Bacteroidota bacterium]|nr:metallopeptidase family protein [Bacteroidota bacterium]